MHEQKLKTVPKSSLDSLNDSIKTDQVVKVESGVSKALERPKQKMIWEFYGIQYRRSTGKFDDALKTKVWGSCILGQMPI